MIKNGRKMIKKRREGLGERKEEQTYCKYIMYLYYLEMLEMFKDTNLALPNIPNSSLPFALFIFTLAAPSSTIASGLSYMKQPLMCWPEYYI